MKIIAFAGSNSKNSINNALVKHVVTYFPEATIQWLDLNDYEAPIYGIDREKQEGIPSVIVSFVDHFEEADLILLSLAEHNGTYTTAFKNIMDWSSRYKLGFFNHVPTFLMATSPGGFGGGNVLAAAKQRLPKFDTTIVEVFSLPKFAENFDHEKGIVHQELRTELEQKIAAIKSSR